MNLESNLAPLTQEDIRSVEGMKNYFKKEGVRFFRERGDIGIKIFLIFMIEKQQFIKDANDLKEIFDDVLKKCEIEKCKNIKM